MCACRDAIGRFAGASGSHRHVSAARAVLLAANDKRANRENRSSTASLLAAAAILVHCVLVAWISSRNAPVSDEAAHLAAGLHTLASGDFDLYAVNPPLVRLVASAPAYFLGAKAGVNPPPRGHGDRRRREWSAGVGLVRDNASDAQLFFALGRLVCLPFSVLGAVCCYHWASEMYASRAGLVSVILWCFSPNIMAWSATICPDAAAASAGVAAAYAFWRWLARPDCCRALLAGVALGLALLTKMTWVVLLAILPAMWAGLAIREGRSGLSGARRAALQLILVLGAGLAALNAGYAFDGSFTRLGQFTFVSRVLAGADSPADGGAGGNRFCGSWLGLLPVPVPRDYLLGMDIQKLDFEAGLESYLCGKWSQRGWWYYYLVCASLKIPLGTCILLLLALCSRLRSCFRRSGWRCRRNMAKKEDYAPRRYRRVGEALILVTVVAILALVSSQTGVNRHFRYMLPAMPFLFIAIGGSAPPRRAPHEMRHRIFISLLLLSLVSGLGVWPHSMSYFNELAGGPLRGHRYLVDSNIDWGQDILYLERWCSRNPSIDVLYTLFRNSYASELFHDAHIKRLGGSGADIRLVSLDLGHDLLTREGPLVGWYAASIHRLCEPACRHAYLLDLEPYARVGYSVWIWHVTSADADKIKSLLARRAASF